MVKTRWLGILVSLASVVGTLAALEMGGRIVKWEWGWNNFLERELYYFWSAYPVDHDPLLGWIPKARAAEGSELWGTQVTIGEFGIRENGRTGSMAQPVQSTPCILAVGDSFAFGAEVSDWETWPAVLEGLLGVHVINAGVFGYGVDQSYLRAKQLVDVYQPEAVIFSLIPDDILRCELSERSGVKKPYFQLANGTLHLKNTPVPVPERRDLGMFKKVTGYSFFFYKLMRKAFPRYWLEGSWSQEGTDAEGEAVACQVILELQKMSAQRNFELLVLIQYEKELTDESQKRIDQLLTCLGDRVDVLDLRQALQAEQIRSPDDYEAMFTSHMTARGNRFVAEAVKSVLTNSSPR